MNPVRDSSGVHDSELGPLFCIPLVQGPRNNFPSLDTLRFHGAHPSVVVTVVATHFGAGTSFLGGGEDPRSLLPAKVASDDCSRIFLRRQIRGPFLLPTRSQALRFTADCWQHSKTHYLRHRPPNVL